MKAEELWKEYAKQVPAMNGPEDGVLEITRANLRKVVTGAWGVGCAHGVEKDKNDKRLSIRAASLFGKIFGD